MLIRAMQVHPPRPRTGYVATRLSTFLTKIAFQSHLLLKGPKGVGKSIAVEQWCALNGIPMISFACCEETSLRDLIGSFSMEGTETPYDLGPLPLAIHQANETARCVLLLEEINTLTPAVQKVINPITDFGCRVDIPRIGKTYQLHPEARLWVVGTGNPGYAGTYDFNEDLLSRFTVLGVPYLTAKEEREALSASFEQMHGRPPDLSETRRINQAITLAGETRGGKAGYAISTRDLEQVFAIAPYVGFEGALLLLQEKFPPEMQANLQTRVKSTFNIDLTKETLL